MDAAERPRDFFMSYFAEHKLLLLLNVVRLKIGLHKNRKNAFMWKYPNKVSAKSAVML
jgi:hypothetical protein